MEYLIGYEFAKQTVVYVSFGVIMALGAAEMISFGEWCIVKAKKGLIPRIRDFFSR